MYLQIVFFFLIGLISSSFSFPEKPPTVPPKEGDEGEFFWRPATREVVNLMRQSINKSVNPCDDFYEFACGNQKANPISLIAGLATAFEKDVRHFIIHEMHKIRDSKAVNSTKIILQSCLNYKPTDMKVYYDKLTELYSRNSLTEIFTDLTNFEIQTSFRIGVIPVPPYDSDVPSYGLALLAPSDLSSKSIPKINEVIDILMPSSKELAAAVKDYTALLLDLSKTTYGVINVTHPSTYTPKWINIKTIERNMDSKLITTPFLERLDKLISETDEKMVRAHTLMKATMAVFDIGERMMLAENREDECAKYIEKELPHIIATTIAKDQLTTEQKNEVKRVFDNVLDSIVESLESQDWLGKSRGTAVKKAREGEQWIGIPEYFNNYEELDAQFEDLRVDNDGTFIDHVAALLRFKQKEKVGLLKSKRNKILDASKSRILTLDAVNFGGYDLTLYTTAILQSPLFYYRFPDFYRYGLLGFVFGHEYGHGLANNGALGPYFGPDKTISQSTKDEFGRRRQCFIEEFYKESLTINGSEYKVSAEFNFNENVADNAAYLVAFKAYKKLWKSTRRPKLLRELKKYTSDQLFFISTAQFFCSNDAREYEKLVVMEDVHAPNPIRVNAVRNSDDFAKAFKCPVGSKMNPEKKCRLWN